MPSQWHKQFGNQINNDNNINDNYNNNDDSSNNNSNNDSKSNNHNEKFLGIISKSCFNKCLENLHELLNYIPLENVRKPKDFFFGKNRN